MYQRLREMRLAFGHVTYPEELVQWIRKTYPDEDPAAMGKYDNQAENQRKEGDLKEFFSIDWGVCRCRNE